MPKTKQKTYLSWYFIVGKCVAKGSSWKGINNLTLFGKHLAMTTKISVFFILSDPVGSRYLLILFCYCANRLLEVKCVIQDHTTGHCEHQDLNLVESKVQSFFLSPHDTSLVSLALSGEGRWLASQCRNSDMTIRFDQDGVDSGQPYKQALGTSLV